MTLRVERASSACQAIQALLGRLEDERDWLAADSGLDGLLDKLADATEVIRSTSHLDGIHMLSFEPNSCGVSLTKRCIQVLLCGRYLAISVSLDLDIRITRLKNNLLKYQRHLGEAFAQTGHGQGFIQRERVLSVMWLAQNGNSNLIPPGGVPWANALFMYVALCSCAGWPSCPTHHQIA